MFFIIIEINITDIKPQIVTYSLLSDIKEELHCSVVKTESITNSVIDKISNDPTNIVSVPLNELITVKSSLLDENTEYSIMCTFPPNVFNSNNYPYQQLNFKTCIILINNYICIVSYISSCPEDGCGFGKCEITTCYCSITSEYNYKTGKCDYEKYNIIIELYYNTIEDVQTVNFNNKLYNDIRTIFSSLYNISINRVNVVKIYNSYIQMKILSYGRIRQSDIINGIDFSRKSSYYIINKFVNDIYNNNNKTLFDIISEKYNRNYTINKSIKPNIYTEDICEPIVTLSETDHLFHFDLSDGSPSILSHNFSIISYNCPLIIYDIRTITGDKDLALEDNIIIIQPSLHSFVLQPNEKFYISVTANPVPIKEFQLYIEHNGVNGYSVVSYSILKGALGYEYNVDYGWNKWVYYFGTDAGIYWFVSSIVIIILAEILLYFIYRICVAVYIYHYFFNFNSFQDQFVSKLQLKKILYLLN